MEDENRDHRNNAHPDSPYGDGRYNRPDGPYGPPAHDGGWGYYAKPKHSGLGIASFILSLVMFAAFIVTITILSVTAVEITKGMEGVPNPEDLAAVLAENPLLLLSGLFMMGIAVGLMIGFVLGIIGLFQSGRNKIFAILGTIFNGFGLFFYLILFAAGLMMG
mgnify:CR=1 FL=1